MARDRRWVVRVLTFTSLLLCLATAGLWVRSFFVYDEFDGDRMDADKRVTDSLYVWTQAGQLAVGRGHLNRPYAFIYAHRAQLRSWRRSFPRRAIITSLWTVSFSRSNNYSWIGADGRRFEDGSWGGSGALAGGYLTQLSVPLAWIAIVSGTLPGVRLWRWRFNARRRESGCCTTCGYNLTGNVSGICPECGKSVERP